jgi:uncharacterized protein
MSGYKTNINDRNCPSVLITGGSGMIGKHLTSLLLAKGYSVTYLSRKVVTGGNVKSFKWDPDKKFIDHEAFKGIDFIIHLAGANIGEKRWTENRKREILESRINSASLLFDRIQSVGINLKGFISASATGIYGSETSQKIFEENDLPSKDFLGSVCRSWEESAGLFCKAGIRTVKLRTGIVLEKNDSALTKLMIPARFGFLVQTGSGHQYMPWIHISDLCRIYLKAMEDTEMCGVYNAVAPQHATHREFMKCLAGVLKVPLFPVPVPEMALKLVLGEMSDIILKGSRVSSEKLLGTGFTFLYRSLEEALSDVINGN